MFLRTFDSDKSAIILIMNSKYVYIDFEAISNPFARLLAIPVNTPFAYTVGA
ncbi:hypothetical protein ACWXVK_00050 [Mycoplasma sp. 3398]